MRSACSLCVFVSVCQVRSGQINCCWPLAAESFLVPGPMGLMTIFYPVCVSVLFSVCAMWGRLQRKHRLQQLDALFSMWSVLC
jgi:hypothetical protein